MKIYAHRGASHDFPENTMIAFENAVKQGADGIELDVHRTKDGRLVVCHDPNVRRTSNGEGNIGEMTYAELLELDFGDGQKIPLLSEVLALLQNTEMLLNIEIKNEENLYPDIEPALLNLVAEFGMEDRVLYSSFDHATLVRLKKLDPTAKTAALYSRTPYDATEYFNKLNVDALHPKFCCLYTDNVCKDALERGQQVNVWTVDDPAEARILQEFGATGIITNRPAFIRESLA